MTFFMLIFLSNCGFGFSCVHEIFIYENLSQCSDAQKEYADKGYQTLCAMGVEGADRQIDIQSIGEPLK